MPGSPRDGGPSGITAPRDPGDGRALHVTARCTPAPNAGRNRATLTGAYRSPSSSAQRPRQRAGSGFPGPGPAVRSPMSPSPVAFGSRSRRCPDSPPLDPMEFDVVDGETLELDASAPQSSMCATARSSLMSVMGCGWGRLTSRWSTPHSRERLEPPREPEPATAVYRAASQRALGAPIAGSARNSPPEPPVTGRRPSPGFELMELDHKSCKAILEQPQPRGLARQVPSPPAARRRA
jgi:hypothetical protein